MNVTVIQIVTLLVSLVALIGIVLAGASRSNARLTLNVVLGFAFAFLLNLGAALAAADGSALGMVCVLGSAGIAVVALR